MYAAVIANCPPAAPAPAPNKQSIWKIVIGWKSNIRNGRVNKQENPEKYATITAPLLHAVLSILRKRKQVPLPFLLENR